MLKSRSFAGLLAISLIMGLAPRAHAQQATPGGPDFDPATRMFSAKNPPIGTQPAQPVAPVITPEQQAEIDRQKQLAEIQQKREEAKKKNEAAQAAQKAREKAAKEADAKRMAELKQMREERMKEMADNREQLAKLLQEEKDARKAYQESKKNSTGTGGGGQSADDTYRKAEQDRQKKIQELRHPKYKPMKLPSTTTTSGTTTSTAGTPAAGTSTALTGTTTTGTGPNATNH